MREGRFPPAAALVKKQQLVSDHKTIKLVHQQKAEHLTSDKTDDLKVNSDSRIIALVGLDVDVDGLVAGQPISFTTLIAVTDLRSEARNCFPSKSAGRSPPPMYDQPDDTPASCSACPWQAGALPLQLPARRLNLPPTKTWAARRRHKQKVIVC